MQVVAQQLEGEQALAQALELPHAPVWWRGTLTEPSQLKALLRRAAARCKCPYPAAKCPRGRPMAPH